MIEIVYSSIQCFTIVTLRMVAYNFWASRVDHKTGVS